MQINTFKHQLFTAYRIVIVNFLLSFRYDILNQINNSMHNSIVSQHESSSSDEMEVDNLNLEKRKNITIDCVTLYTFMNEQHINILIMDCRSKNEFKSSKILYKQYLNIAEEHLTSG